MEQAENFLAKHAARELKTAEKITALKLLEMQRHAMLMYTSCGWFFDEVSGIETVQVIEYAARALQLSHDLVEAGVEKRFLELLQEAKSNLAEHKDGAHIYRAMVLPSRLDLLKVGAHFAFSSLFEEYEEHAQVYCYAVAKEDFTKIVTPEASIAMGRIHVASELTEEAERLFFCVVRFGNHDFKGGISTQSDAAAYASIKEELSAAFDKGLFTELIALMDKYFGNHSYSLSNLFRDEQRKILNLIIDKSMQESVASYQSIFEEGRALMEFIRQTGMPVPKAFLISAQPALNAALKTALTREEIDSDEVPRIVDQIEKWQVAMDQPDTEFFLRSHLQGLMRALTCEPADLKLMSRIDQFMEILKTTPVELELWQIQNDYYLMAKTVYRDYLAGEKNGTDGASAWLAGFKKLGEQFHFDLDAILQEQ
jgi:alpha-amylase/alpha-mannosidase (GH57 family)